MTLQKTSREQPSLQRSNRRVRTVRDEDDVERKTRRPVVTLALEVPLSQEMNRIEAQPCDRGLNGLVVRSCWMESEAPENRAHGNAGRHRVDELILRPRAPLTGRVIRMVPEVGFEPTRTCAHELLRLACLPFHHSG